MFCIFQFVPKPRLVTHFVENDVCNSTLKIPGINNKTISKHLNIAKISTLAWFLIFHPVTELRDLKAKYVINLQIYNLFSIASLLNSNFVLTYTTILPLNVTMCRFWFCMVLPWSNIVKEGPQNHCKNNSIC